ncbi:hypothetical protein DEJ60_16430 [Bacilli bacterium]|nr:hypothetical protein DEJ60_16430 [Bacilli bacterium]
MIKRIKDYDYTLIIAPLVLAAFGLVMIYSASMVTAVVEGYKSNHYLIRQAIWFAFGLLGFVFTSIFPYKKYQKLMKLIIILVITQLSQPKLGRYTLI